MHTANHNQTRMQNRDYCREEHFLSDEKHFLQALPDEAFEIKYYKEYKLAQKTIFTLDRTNIITVPLINILGRNSKWFTPGQWSVFFIITTLSLSMKEAL